MPSEKMRDTVAVDCLEQSLLGYGRTSFSWTAVNPMAFSRGDFESVHHESRPRSTGCLSIFLLLLEIIEHPTPGAGVFSVTPRRESFAANAPPIGNVLAPHDRPRAGKPEENPPHAPRAHPGPQTIHLSSPRHPSRSTGCAFTPQPHASAASPAHAARHVRGSPCRERPPRAPSTPR